MGHIVSRARIEPTSIAFWVTVRTITPPRFPDVTILPMPSCLCGSLVDRSMQTDVLVPWNCKSFSASNYTNFVNNDLTYTYTG